VVFLCLAIRAVYKSKAKSFSTNDATDVEVVRYVSALLKCDCVCWFSERY